MPKLSSMGWLDIIFGTFTLKRFPLTRYYRNFFLVQTRQLACFLYFSSQRSAFLYEFSGAAIIDHINKIPQQQCFFFFLIIIPFLLIFFMDKGSTFLSRGELRSYWPEGKKYSFIGWCTLPCQPIRGCHLSFSDQLREQGTQND